MSHHVLILGGTAEARDLAAAIAGTVPRITLSLAGRTARPAPQPVPTRSGGFGGAAGLARHVARHGVTLLVDATHPYAVRISQNAAEAAEAAGIPILALRRPEWRQADGDRWVVSASVAAAVAALGKTPRRVLVTLGRQELGPLEAAPQHGYVVRSVDPVEPPLALPDVCYILARGPFTEAAERDLMVERGIEAVLSKNSGGTATYGKIAAARALGIAVHMVARPALPAVPGAETVPKLAEMIRHHTTSRAERGE